MDYIIIEVPDLNDSVSRIVLDGKQYQIRFTWNDTGGFWTFGLMDSLGTPLLIGVKVVPQFPLNLFYGTQNLPVGVFAALTEQDTIGRSDFVDGKAKFVFAPAG
jgi:hypothetical protein